jgi:hypothetical protein
MKAIIFFKNISNGYRQISTIKIVLKSVLKKNKLPITMLVALSEKSLNGFMLRQLLINMRKQRLV